MKSLYLQELNLENYRNFNKFSLKINNNPIALIGENGSGKTNILEAISQLFPGKGIRSAKLDEICNRGSNNWCVHALLDSKLSTCELSIQYQNSKRLNLFNGSKIQNHELNRLLSIIWLTPQMDGIFLGSNSDRRKFFDRIVYNFDLNHAKNLNIYAYYMLERIKLLTSDFIDESWVKVLEEKLAEVSQLIAVSRIETIIKIQKTMDNLESDFPKALLTIDGDVETYILNNNEPANVIEYIMHELYKQRSKDRITGKTHFGIHRSDFLVKHTKQDRLAKFCSTGEQKAMLVSIILAQVYSIMQEQMIKPIILLDEVFVHLDDKRKAHLSEMLVFFNAQSWVTATDIKGIEKFMAHGELVKI